MTGNRARYDRTGRTYARTRRADPRIATEISRALADGGTVANVGAGSGSYEPERTVVAIEPSSVMIGQRPPGAAPAVRAVAEDIPLGDNTVDTALAVLTVHHWNDLDRGIAELTRIARRRIVIFTWDHAVTRNFWLLRDYLPAAAATDARLAVPMHRFAELLDAPAVRAVPIPADCTDGFGGAYWRRPHAYLDPLVRAGMSMLALTPDHLLQPGLSQLRSDLAAGRWHRRQDALLEHTELDLGYRLVIADL